MNDTASNSPLFTSAHAALVFAFNFNMQQYDRPLMNRLAGKQAASSGLGLSGLDGAAQAGMIRRRVATLPVVYQSILVTRLAPPQLVCECGAPCCCGKQANLEWQGALRIVADYAEREALGNCTVNRPLTLALLMRLFSLDARHLSDIAKEVGVAPNTATNHNARLKGWLLGENGRGTGAATPGRDALAMEAAEYVLTEAGIVGQLQTA